MSTTNRLRWTGRVPPVDGLFFPRYLSPMSITTEDFGQTPDGAPVFLYTLTNAHGLRATVTNYGAHLTQLHVPDRHGTLGNVILGFESLAGYLAPHPYIGATVGRFANRIANGRFSLNGRQYQLATNNGPNHLHGGIRGFDKVLWRTTLSDTSLQLSYDAHDGEEGYPGALSVSVTFTLTDADEFRIDYRAIAQAPTVLNLTNHAYFNLSGPGSGMILDHQLQIDAGHYLPTDDLQIPTGALADVSDTPHDFRLTRPIGQRIDQTDGGYDHNYCLNHTPGQVAHAATLYDPRSGRTMELHTDQPGLQLYTGNKLDGTLTGIGGHYPQHAALCLETQHYPDAPNHPHFPSTTLNPGQTFRSTTLFRFSARA